VTVDVSLASRRCGKLPISRSVLGRELKQRKIMTEPAQLLPHAERLQTMARVARGVAARLAQQTDRKRLEGYAENLERQASDILTSASRQTNRGPSH
jgi:hypothetical protein